MLASPAMQAKNKEGPTGFASYSWTTIVGIMIPANLAIIAFIDVPVVRT